MDWEAPTIVLDARPLGEGDVVATVMNQEHGLHRGLVRGGGSRAKAGTWQAGNLVQVRWIARLSDQLGSFTGELIHAGSAHVMEAALPLAMLASVCAVAAGALPEREPQPRIFNRLLKLIPRLPLGESQLADVVRWELVVLSDLGYGLDVSCCAVTGRTEGLTHVSPRTGRAVTLEGAGMWSGRLLPLAGFMIGEGDAGFPAWRDGLRLTGHFLARDVFGHQHRPLPQARQMLYDRVSTMAGQAESSVLAANQNRGIKEKHAR